MSPPSIIAPAAVTFTCVTVQHLTDGSDAQEIIRPLGATLLAYGVLGATSYKAPKLTNMFAWTIAATAVVTLGVPVITKYFPSKGTK